MHVLCCCCFCECVLFSYFFFNKKNSVISFSLEVPEQGYSNEYPEHKFFGGGVLQQKKNMPNRGSLFFTAMLYLPTILHFLRGHFRLMIKPEEIGKDIQALSFTIALNNALLSTTTPTKNKTRGPRWSYIAHLTKQICIFTVEVSAKFTALGFLYKLYSTNHPHPPPPHPGHVFFTNLDNLN